MLSGYPGDGIPAASPKTDTVYVPIQCTTSSCQHAEHVVDVINTAKCNTKIILGLPGGGPGQRRQRPDSRPPSTPGPTPFM